MALTTKNSKSFGEIFNVGTNNNISISELFYLITEILEKPNLKPIYSDIRKGDVPYSRASIDKINEFLNYSPKIYFKEGLIKTIQNYKEHHKK